MPIQFFLSDTKITLKEKARLKLFIAGIFRKNQIKLRSLSFIFCSDQRILEINKAYLKHDYYTDIITFDLADPGNPVEGEVYISVDRIRDNAEIQQVTLKQEIHRVMFHGVLHLCGYKDKSARDKKKMTAEEDKLLYLYFASVPRITVSNRNR